MDTKPDEYYNNGSFEMARFGEHIVLRNNMDSKQHKRVINRFKKRYPKIKRKIDKSIRSLTKKILSCDPIQLLSFASDFALNTNLGISSEFQLSKDDIFICRMTEYIQSVYTSMPLTYKKSDKDPSRKFFGIMRDFKKLYDYIHIFYISWMAQIDELYPEYDEEIRKSIAESQLLYIVRGKRYQIFEIEYFERLLIKHDDILKNLFNVSSAEVIEGIKKLQFALSQGKFSAYNKFGELLDDYLENSEADAKSFYSEHSVESAEFVNSFFGTKLRDVIEVTGWPESFVECLSWKLGECSDFFGEREFSGWPIIDLPIQKRPFIKIEGNYYCFDYYSFIDNFYRDIQKAVSRKKPDYKWSDVQKEASEEMVSDVFSQILPGCESYRDNYYPKNKSLKNLVENDLIIKYFDTLFIVEVKAGSFVYTAPIADFKNHIKSYKNLIEKADHQCKNTLDYLCSKKDPIIYNYDGTEKVQFDMSKIKDIYMISVTIDNINDFAAKAEKLNFLELKSNAISLSIDDLMVYREYFDSPLVFLHFLKQRQIATQEKKLALNDELDHLGMYIKHNMYCKQLSNYSEDSIVVFEGYREELDKYFCALYHPQLNPTKPSLNIPDKISEIINYLNGGSVYNKIQISNYLLSFSSDAKNAFCQYVDYTLKRQKETGNMLAVNTSGNEDDTLRYTMFVEQPGIKVFSNDYKKDYVLSTLLWNEENDRVMIELIYDNNNSLSGVQCRTFTKNDICNCDIKRLNKIATTRALQRLTGYINQNGKINDDDYCPCVSGKLYKECCSKREFI